MKERQSKQTSLYINKLYCFRYFKQWEDPIIQAVLDAVYVMNA